MFWRVKADQEKPYNYAVFLDFSDSLWYNQKQNMKK